MTNRTFVVAVFSLIVIASHDLFAQNVSQPAQGDVGKPGFGRPPIGPGSINPDGDKVLGPNEKAPGEVPIILPGRTTLIMYDYIYCKNLRFPGEWCSDYVSMKAPNGYQICDYVIGNISLGRGAGYSVIGEELLSNEGMVLRIKSIRLGYHAYASSDPLDQYGSDIHLRDVGIVVVPEGANYKLREELKCQMFLQGATPRLK